MTGQDAVRVAEEFHARVNPQLVDIRVVLNHPGVVVVGQHVNFRVWQHTPQMRQHGRGEQQVADFIAFEDQDFHEGC